MGLALLSGIVFGLFPALQSARPEISQVMQAGTRRLTGSVKGRRLHTALIAGQIALTLLLMTAAGAAIQAFIRMNRVPLGYEPKHVMSVVIPPERKCAHNLGRPQPLLRAASGESRSNSRRAWGRDIDQRHSAG